jgi:myosin heavy subunit
MAKEIGIKITADTKQAVKSVGDLADEVDVVTGSLGDLERQQDELLEKLKGVKVGTKDFQELASQLNKVKSEIKDAELAFEGLDMEQRFTAGADALGGIAGGFAGVEGAMAIMGAESANFEKTLMRVQGAMALAMGVKDISTAVVAMKKMNVATKAWNLVTNANPIVLILTGVIAVIGTVIASMGKLKAVTQGVGDAVNWVGRQLGLLPSKAEQAEAKMREEAMKTKLARIESSREATDQKLKDLDEESKAITSKFDFEIAKLQASGDETYEVEQKKLKAVLENLAKQKQALKDKFDYEKKLEAESLKDFQKNNDIRDLITSLEAKQRRIETKKTLKEVEESEVKTQQQITVNEIKEEKKRSDKRKANYKKAQDDRKKQADLELKQRRRLEDEKNKAIENDYLREREMLKTKHERELEDLEAQGLLTTELRKQLVANQNAELDKQEEEYWKEREAEIQKEADEKKVQAKIDADARIEEQRQEDLEKEKAIADAKQLLQDSVVKGAEALTSLLIKDAEKAEKVQKAIALAQIAIDTAKAISSLVANSEGNPLNAVTGGLAGVAQFASGIARILANVAQASALLKKSPPSVNASAGGGTSSGAGAGVPINAVQSGSTLLQQSQQGQQTSKVVVVESDITSTQNSISSIQEQATVVE